MKVVHTGIDDAKGVGRGTDDVNVVRTGIDDLRGVGRGADDVRGVVEGQMM